MEFKRCSQNRFSPRMHKAWEKFGKDLQSFMAETGEETATLYEDAFTTRNVKDFILTNTKLEWIEDGVLEKEDLFDDEEARDYLSFWRANLRRAKKYWSMDTETLDNIQEGEIEDIEEE